MKGQMSSRLLAAAFLLAPTVALWRQAPTCDCKMAYSSYLGTPVAACPIVACDEAPYCDEVDAQAPSGNDVRKCACSDHGEPPAVFFDDECSCDGWFDFTTNTPDCHTDHCPLLHTCKLPAPLPPFPVQSSCDCKK